MVLRRNEAILEILTLPSDKMGETVLSTNRLDKEVSCFDSQEAFVGTTTEKKHKVTSG